MRAVVIAESGGPEQLRWEKVETPEPGPSDVLIDVAASAVNRADIAQRQGNYPPPPGVPEWPGLECSGTIRAVGGSVHEWAPGDEVCALLAGGGYAEQVVVPAEHVLPIPAGIDLLTAAALPEAVCTVWSNVVMTGQLRSGDVLLVHGGASGIGTMAIQVGVALGAAVAVTAGSQEKLDRCAELGASMLVNYKNDDFAHELRAATNGHGADVILDIIGAKYLDKNLDALAVDGRLVVIGLQGGRRAELDLLKVWSKRAWVTGSTLRHRTVEEKAAVVAAVRADAWPLVAAGSLRPVIDRSFPMKEASRAHEHVEQGRHVGKVLLTT